MDQSFAERFDGKPAPQIQLRVCGRDLRIRLWNVFKTYMDNLNNVHQAIDFEYQLRRMLWVDLFLFLVDNFPDEDGSHVNREIYRATFFKSANKWFFCEKREWTDFYSMFEFLASFRNNEETFDSLKSQLNRVLEREHSGYRMVGRQFVAITNQLELNEIDSSLAIPDKALKPVLLHLQKAVTLFSDRESPDYGNSIKESISALEALCFLISGQKGLSSGLEKTTKELGLSENLREGFKHLFWYTSDEKGIRHANKDVSQATEEEARYMLVTLSAIVNFIIDKARKMNKLPK